MAQECAKLKPFLNNVRRRTFEDADTQSMVESAFEYHGLLNNTLKRMSGKKGYSRCKEQFSSTSTGYIPEDDVNLEEMKERFIKRVFNDKMTDALPLVHKAYNMKKENKFTEQFETWATAISEGTWALPETDEDKDKLIDILSQELPVGVDAINAKELLYNIFGDDSLFDALEELAEVDPQADARDTVMDHLMEKNPTMYQAILDAIGDEDTPEPAEAGDTEGGDLDEGVAVKHLSDATAKAIINDNDNIIYDILAGHTKVQPGEQELLQDMYNDIASDKGYASDDDFEEIQDLMYDYIQHDYSHVAEGNTYGSGDGGMDGQVEEAKDKVSYDPKTGKLTGWEHEGDWKKSTGKDPVGKIHHMSDVARKRTEKMAKDQVSENDEDELSNIESIQSAIIRRILNDINQHSELLKKAGPDGVMNASLDVASFHAPMEEIGSSDVSIMVREVYREVGVDYPEEEHSDLHEAFNKALGEGYDTRDAYELEDPKHPDFVKNYEEYKSTHPDAKLADFINFLRSNKGLNEADSRFMSFLEPLVGQEVYIPGEGTTGTVVGPSPNPKLPTGIQVKLSNGQLVTTGPGLFKSTKPGLVQQAIDKLNSLTGKIDPVPSVAKPYGTVAGPMDNLHKQDWSSVKEDILKLAGMK
jgi:hypothetical protein